MKVILISILICSLKAKAQTAQEMWSELDVAMGKELTHQLTARETSEQESEQIRNIEQTVRTGQAAPTRSGQSLENTVPIRELTRKRSYNRGKRLKRNIRTTRQRSR